MRPPRLRRRAAGSASEQLVGPDRQPGQASRDAGALPLAVREVTVSFGGVRALEDVSLTLSQGERLGVIGQNGAGKTTLFNVIMGAVRPDSGQVRLFGKDISSWSPLARARAGLRRTFQDVRLFPQLTVQEHLEVVVPMNGGCPLSPRELIEMLDLGAWQHTVGGRLPAGVMRRVDVGRALAGAAQLLLVDEPGAGLSEVELDNLVSALRHVNAEVGTPMLIIDHDMRFISGLCERVIVLDGGRELAAGTAEEVAADERVRRAYLEALPVGRAGRRPARRPWQRYRWAAAGSAGAAGRRPVSRLRLRSRRAKPEPARSAGRADGTDRSQRRG
jgi:ABC-type branched-subunit amino acid transport system ATPase component